MPDAPLLSIVTPCLNPGPRLERALRSIAAAPPGLVEHLIMDGGSTDGSAARIAEFAREHPGLVASWTSAPDAGQSDAINRGLARSRGVFGCWLNADDWYEPGALGRVVERLRGASFDVLVARARFVDERGRSIWEPTPPNPVTPGALASLRAGWFAGRSIAQPEAFFRLELFRRVGGLRVENHYSMDHELWMELAAAGARFEDWPVLVASLGVHAGQKTADRLESARCITGSTRAFLARHRGALAASAGEIERELDELHRRITLVDRVESWWARFDRPPDPSRPPDWAAVATYETLARHLPCRAASRRALRRARRPIIRWILDRGHRPERVLVLMRGGWPLVSGLRREWARRGETPAITLLTPSPWIAGRPRCDGLRILPLGSSAGASDPLIPAALGRFDLVITENVLACGPDSIAASVWGALEPGGVWAQSAEPLAGPDAQRRLAALRDELRAAVTRSGDALISTSADAGLDSAASLAAEHAAAEPFAAGVDVGAILARIAPGARRVWRHEVPSLDGLLLAPITTNEPGRGWSSSAWIKPG